MSDPVSRRNFLTTTTAAGVGVVATENAAFSANESSTASMPLRPLGKTGRMISIIGFGAGSRYLLQKDMDTAEAMIHRAVELGINYFDTAYGYQTDGICESHKRYGRFLVPNYRDKITLSSKIMARDEETAKRQLEEALKDLRTDHLDILHFHGIDTSEDIDKILAKDGALKAYRKWKEEGVIGAIGLTGHSNSEAILEAMKRIQPDCVMCPQNPAHGENVQGYRGLNFAKDVIPYALDNGLGLLAMKTTAQNHLIGKGGIPVETLIRYALTLPVAAAVIGMPNMEVVESNARIARTLKPMTDTERITINKQVAYSGAARSLPYRAKGYQDGEHLA